MSASTGSSASLTRAAAVLAALIALTACADDPMRPAAARTPAPVVPRAGLTTLPVMTISVTDLGTLGAFFGRNESRAYGINDSGVVTGKTTMAGAASYWDDAVFRWHSATGMQFTSVYGTGRDINLGGTIVGESYSLPGGSLGKGFVVSSSNVMTPLPWLLHNYSSWAEGINDAGYIVGANDDGDPLVTGYDLIGTRWAPGTLAITDYLPGSGVSPGSVLRDINNSNQMVGYSFGAAGAAGFRWSPWVGYEYIKPWSATVSVQPKDINDAGTVAGYEFASGAIRPFRWSPAAGFSYLGPAAEQGQAFGISAGGYAVGHAAAAPVFWKPDGTRVFLPRLAGPAAAPCSWMDCAAQAANSRLEITGYDRTATGEVHAVVWRVRFLYRVLVLLYPLEPIQPPFRYGAEGLIPTALLTTPDFDARETKPSLLRLGNGDGDDTPVAVDRYGRRLVAYEDVDRDGDLDLLVYFSQAALERNGDLTPETTVLYLTADLGDDNHLRGEKRVEVAK